MKKSLLALAVAGAFSGAAFAQSSVTLYGIIDVGLNFDGSIPVRNPATSAIDKKTRFAIDTGGQSGSRIGLRGSEDLGGGLKGNFVFETGFCADGNGSADRGIANQNNFCTGGNYFGGRNTNVGLSQAGVGRFDLGRQYAPHFAVLNNLDPFGTGLAGNIGNIFLTPIRYSNSVTLTSANYGGFFTGQLAYGAGDSTLSNSAGRNLGASADINFAPVYIGLALHQSKSNPAPTAANPNPAVDTSAQVGLIGVVVDLSVVKIHLAGQRVRKLPTVTFQGASIDQDQDQYMIGLTVPFGANTFLLSGARDNYKNTAFSDPQMVAVGWTYELSKRTNTYVAFGKGRNSERLPGLLPAPGDPGLIGDATFAGTGERKFQLGMRHKF